MDTNGQRMIVPSFAQWQWLSPIEADSLPWRPTMVRFDVISAGTNQGHVEVALTADEELRLRTMLADVFARYQRELLSPVQVVGVS